MNRPFFLSVVLLFITTQVQAQYWFGPKAGFLLTDHTYQSKTYEADSFKVALDYNFQVGAVLTYDASDRFSVHTELNFERYGKKLRSFDTINYARTRLNYGFLTVPLVMRFNFGRAPFLFYVNGGTKLSYWLYGNGQIDAAGREEAEDPILDYTLVFSSNADFDKLHLERPNRLQYSLLFGGGAYFDMRNDARIMLDIRYNFGHSNMGFNGSPDFDFETYYENFEYRHNTLSISVGYMFEYNAQLRRKGRSTNSLSNKKKK